MSVEKREYADPVLIGEGAFSKVYRVEKNGMFYACKISPLSEMSKREAAFLKQIRHPLFPRYIEAFTGEGEMYLVMEYVAGNNLQELVRRRGGLSQRQMVQIILALAEGLQYLHELSGPIIFRDVKPQNIMICQTGAVKLVDVGAACFLEESRGEGCGTRAGSLGYAAPEQLLPGHKIGVESDIYALAVLAQFIRYGQRTSKGLQAVFEQAMQKEQSDRIPDMRMFIEKIARYDGRHPGKAIQEDILSCFRKNRKSEFYYEKNINKG